MMLHCCNLLYESRMDWLETGYDEHMRAVKGAQHQQKLSAAELKVAEELRAKYGAEKAMVC
jgi:hypothetical protein